jgi:hypothetical protein
MMQLKNIKYLITEVITTCHDINAFQNISLFIVFMLVLFFVPGNSRRKLSQINFLAAATVALESTGFTKLFGYQKVDRHVQSMIVRLKKQDKEVIGLIDEHLLILLDKICKDDLSEEEFLVVTEIMEKLIDRTNSTFNLVMELESKYGLGMTDYMQGKEKSPVQQHRRLS